MNGGIIAGRGREKLAGQRTALIKVFAEIGAAAAPCAFAFFGIKILNFVPTSGVE